MYGRPLSGEAFSSLAREILNAGNSLRFKARGTSMQPAIQDGDIIVVTPWRRKARRGDILLVEYGSDSLQAHRLLGKRGQEGRQQYLTQGDACLEVDGWFPESCILGRVVSLERGEHKYRLDAFPRQLLGWLRAEKSLLQPLASRLRSTFGQRRQKTP